MRIVHIIGSGHAGNWAVYPLLKLKEAGHEIIAICPENGTLEKRLRDKNITVYTTDFPQRLFKITKDLKCINNLKKLLVQIKPDVVHLHLTHAIFLGRFASWLAEVPVRISAWPGPAPLEKWSVKILDFLTNWMDTVIIASSSATLNIYKKNPLTRNKVYLIYYGFPLEPFNPLIDGKSMREKFKASSEDFIVALIAYMYPPNKNLYDGYGLKGHEILIMGAKEVIKKNNKIKFWIIGDPLTDAGVKYEEYLKKMVKELGLDNHVCFTGYISDIPSVISAADAVVVPSFSENVGGAVEPLLMEKPVIASNVGGLPDVVIENKTGFLIPPGNPHVLAESVLKTAQLSPEMRQTMGRQGRKIVTELFDIDKTVRQTEALYFKLLNRKK